MKKIILAIVSLILFLVITLYASLGIFVVQPIGMVPNGVTIVYLRIGTKMPFIASADGILLKKQGCFSLFERGAVLSSIVIGIKSKIIMMAPYSKSLYLFSTNGREFHN